MLVRLDTDASQELIGAVFQNGDEKVIPYISHLPTKVEKDNFCNEKKVFSSSIFHAALSISVSIFKYCHTHTYIHTVCAFLIHVPNLFVHYNLCM